MASSNYSNKWFKIGRGYSSVCCFFQIERPTLTLSYLVKTNPLNLGQVQEDFRFLVIARDKAPSSIWSNISDNPGRYKLPQPYFAQSMHVVKAGLWSRRASAMSSPHLMQ